MGDSWEDWDADDYTPPLPGAAGAAAKVDSSKFADEDQGDDERPKWEQNVPKPQQPKKVESKYDENRGLSSVADEGPLDDPIAEKLRQQRLVEEADFKATMELFGSGRELEGFIPKSAKDFEEYAALVVSKYLLPQSKSSHYKLLVKQLIKHALTPVSAQDAKDIETCVAGIRSEKLKDEKVVAAAGKKSQKKAALNVGRGGGSAGLDDYQYDVADDDDFDFM